MLLIYIVAALILILLVRISVKVEVHNNNICVLLAFLWIIRIRRCYLIKREKNDIFSLYRIKDEDQKKVISLYDIIQRVGKKKQTKNQKRALKKMLGYIYKKASIDIKINLAAGISGAAMTAMICGGVGAAMSAVDAILKNKHRRIHVQIKPFYAKQYFSIEAKGIMALSPANIIVGYILYQKTKRR